MTDTALHQLVVYVPEEHAELLKTALFEAGAGRVGNYDHCCWQTSGTGQFRPRPGSCPTLGSHDVVEHVSELRLEMVVESSHLDIVLDALRQAHPYETPAFSHWPINRTKGF